MYISVTLYLRGARGARAVASAAVSVVPIRARTARAKCRVEKKAIYTGKRDTASEESKAKEIESLTD